MSGEIEVKMTVRGIPAALRLLDTIPTGIVGPTVEPSLQGLMGMGMTLMAQHIREMVTPDKSLGVLAESIQGVREPVDPLPQSGQAGEAMSENVTITIGSSVPYAGYAAREIGWSQINRNVLLQTGRWVWVGSRPPIPAHPFLEYTVDDLLNRVLPKELKDNFMVNAINIQRDVDALQSSEAK